MTTRRRFTAEFKAKVAPEALRGDKTIQEFTVQALRDHRLGQNMEHLALGLGWCPVPWRSPPRSAKLSSPAPSPRA